MRGFLGKLGYVHKRLWQQDGGYRVSTLLGPAPLAGGLIALAIWGGTLEVRRQTYPPPWATRSEPSVWSSSADRPQALQPTWSLTEASAVPAGFEPGWIVVAHPLEVGPTLDANVKPEVLTRSMLASGSVDMAQILAGGPQGRLYAGGGTGFFVARQSGVYAFAARFEHPPGPTANCVTRLGVGPHRVSANLELNVNGAFARDYRPAWFTLQPGLYPVAWVLGCWHDQQVTGTGRITLLVSHPGDNKLMPVRPDDIVRPQ